MIKIGYFYVITRCRWIMQYYEIQDFCCIGGFILRMLNDLDKNEIGSCVYHALGVMTVMLQSRRWKWSHASETKKPFQPAPITATITVTS